MQKEIDLILSQIDKPLRYINHEINAFHKNFETSEVRFCFIYPDVYEVGISHLGIKILYTIVNNLPDSMADRAYTPWPDFGDKLIEKGIPLYSIETKKNLKEFDCLGFTLQTELIYTNILYTLDLAQIPLRSKERQELDPIILAGGINAVNPQPLSYFIDAFFIGEAEDGIVIIKDIFKKEKNRQQRLKLLAELDFVYVPEYSDKKMIKGLKYNSFSTSEKTHFPQLVPLLEGTHNRYTAEIMRGCTRGCRFCQAGMFYRPTREKDPEIIIKQLISEINNSGWDQAGLMSLSSSDYSCIKTLLQELITQLKGSGTSLSLPSLRIDNLDTNLVELINHLRKQGITLAPEAGTQRLRDMINKNLTEEEILEAVKFAYETGAKLVKLYFMIGLPFETDEDIDGITELIEKIIILTNRKMRINISVSPFVPKPMTPFQWAKMNSESVALSKALKIKHSLSKYKFVKMNYHTIELSFLEAVLCRGDITTGEVIEKAYRNGAKFDAWREFFDYSIWEKSALEVKFDWYKPINGFDLDEVLPWDNIGVGVSKDFLKQELKNAENMITTQDCRNDICVNCGACDENNAPVYVHGDSLLKPEIKSLVEKIDKNQDLNTDSKYLYRIFYSKVNDLKYLSHLDFLRLVHRLLMFSDLPVTFSQGFNPHPKTAFCPPLSSGIEGENEFFDVWLAKKCSTNEFIKQLKKTEIRDLAFNKVILLHEDCKYKENYIPISKFDIESLEVEFKDLNEQAKFIYEKKLNLFLIGNDTFIRKVRKGKERNIDLKDIILQVNMKDDKFVIMKKISGASVFDILLKIFNIERVNAGELRIIRKELFAEA